MSERFTRLRALTEEQFEACKQLFAEELRLENMSMGCVAHEAVQKVLDNADLSTKMAFDIMLEAGLLNQSYPVPDDDYCNVNQIILWGLRCELAWYVLAKEGWADEDMSEGLLEQAQEICPHPAEWRNADDPTSDEWCGRCLKQLQEA